LVERADYIVRRMAVASHDYQSERSHDVGTSAPESETHRFVKLIGSPFYCQKRLDNEMQCLKICIIYLLIAIGLSSGGNSAVHIYTQTIHRTTQITTEEQK
jgi:hypothetical protein